MVLSCRRKFRNRTAFVRMRFTVENTSGNAEYRSLEQTRNLACILLAWALRVRNRPFMTYEATDEIAFSATPALPGRA
jgi:hypothetical protein